ncbi:Uma2 family endonuclease [Leptolyngbya sp. NIES-2104]|uniref:Uma2 family endonuclease n=1 Tax=Leptolyngbya sp. NIES-2104 TaxID=1552121 RepID=UPI001CECF30B|nr:Uma2 family endonuclease [Leptolyngbya sp. NIES-2104]
MFDLKPIIDLTDDQFYQLCQINSDVRFERDAAGKILIMSPAGAIISNRNCEIGSELELWNRQAQLGICFGASTGFGLPNGAVRAPSLTWLKQSRWDALTPEEQEKFPPVAPDFVLELMSSFDSLEETQARLREYMENGVRLGWLIDRKTRRVEVYRSNQPVEVLENPVSLSGEDVLPEFVLNLAIVW